MLKAYTKMYEPKADTKHSFLFTKTKFIAYKRKPEASEKKKI